MNNGNKKIHLGSPGQVAQFDTTPSKCTEIKQVVEKTRSASAPGSNSVPYRVRKNCPMVLKPLWRGELPGKPNLSQRHGAERFNQLSSRKRKIPETSPSSEASPHLTWKWRFLSSWWGQDTLILYVNKKNSSFRLSRAASYDFWC